MRVSIQISTGKVLEMQSDATPGTLTANAVAAGFLAADIQERVVTEAEYRVLVPVRAPIDNSDLDLINKQMKALALLLRTYTNQTRTGVTTAITLAALKSDFKTAFDSLP